jgi:sodium-dependent dicarboxylate transporter 2/3/5
VATPPNAIVFGSGHLTVPQMARAGLLVNLVGIALITALAYLLLPVVFGLEPGRIPDWARAP